MRRKFLARVVVGVQGLIAATLGTLLGGAALAPSFERRGKNWIRAAALADLVDDEPVPVTIRLERNDGYARIVDRQVIFLVKAGDANVVALSSVCTHLGCRVSWNREAKELRCPCHGGAFDRHGTVKAGPPPAPLAVVPVHVEGEQILVQL